MGLSIAKVGLADADAKTLTAASVAEINGRYGGVPGVGGKPRPEQFEPPEGIFLLARVDGQAVGCGGISRIDAETGELRRMYVVPEMRKRGLARHLLSRLLEAARELGYRRVWLETGNLQAEAIGLYRGAGFRLITCWGPFLEDPRSLCFEIDL